MFDSEFKRGVMRPGFLFANGVGVVVAVAILSLFPAVLRARSEEIRS